MVSPEEANGFLAVVYEMMERMTREDRKWFRKALKVAAKQMDIDYPNGKIDAPIEEKKVDLILPKGGTDGIIKA